MNFPAQVIENKEDLNFSNEIKDLYGEVNSLDNLLLYMEKIRVYEKVNVFKDLQCIVNIVRKSLLLLRKFKISKSG